MANSDSTPPKVDGFIDSLRRWLAKVSYKVPVSWDSETGDVIIGRRGRIAMSELESDGGFQAAFDRATGWVNDWRQIWMDETSFRSPAGEFQDDLADFIAYFGNAPWLPEARVGGVHTPRSPMVPTPIGVSPRCPRCSTTMVSGQLFYDGILRLGLAKWQDDQPHGSAKTSVLCVKGFRCRDCGHLELFAR